MVSRSFAMWGTRSASAQLAVVISLSVALFGSLPPALAQAPPAPEKIREIFVPFEDLNVILESDAQRAFLTRQEYEELIAKAAAKPVVKVPLSAAVVAAQYTARLEEARALIDGKLQVDLLEDGLFAVPLELGGVGIRSALLDGKPAPLSRNEQGQVVLFVQGAGKHELVLALTAPVATSAATQSLSLSLPLTAATKLELTVPGDVEIRGGASVVNRTFDAAAGLTKFELLPQRGQLGIVMSLNNKMLQEQRVVVASSVLVTEVTQGYERLHATVSHRVLHGAVDKLRFELPAGFEVTQVASPLLARWEVKKDAMPAVLEAILREPTTEPIVLAITATRSPPALEKWSLPRLVPLDVAGQVAVVGLLVEDRFDPQRITTGGLIPVDADTLSAAIPQSVFQAEPGAPTVRQTVSFYAPARDYQLSAEFARPPVELRIASSGLMTLAEKQLRYSGTVLLMPQAEDQFNFRLSVPAPWQVTEVAKADGTPLTYERYDVPAMPGAAAAGMRLNVRIPGGIKAGQQLAVRFQAVAAPAGWLADWETQKVEFPQFVVDGAVRDSGPVGIKVEDDLAVRPEKAEGLVPLSDAERQQLTGGSEQLALAYRFEQRPFALSLVAERIAASLTADVYCFLALDADHLDAAYELHYAVRDARTQKVEFSLPKSAPEELDILQIDPANPASRIKVKETNSRVVGDRRIWTVQLAERQAGQIWLAATFQQRFDKTEPRGVRMPLAQAEGVDHQSVVVGIEGGSDLDIQVTSHPAEVDVGELQGNVAYEISRRLIGAYGYAGVEGEANKVVVDVLRREQHGLPAALVERAELVTRVAQAGRSQSVARYDLKTKATLIEIELPPGAKLWTIFLDGQPTKPQKEGDRLLLTLPAQSEAIGRTLQVVYEAKQSPLGLSGSIAAEAPQILLRVDPADEAVAIPQANLAWTLVVPSGYMIRRADGTVFTDELPPRELAAVKSARWVWKLLNTPLWSVQYAREAARRGDVGNSLQLDDSYSMTSPEAAATAEPSSGVELGGMGLPAGVKAMLDAPPTEGTESESAKQRVPMAEAKTESPRDEFRAKVKRDLALEQAARRHSLAQSQQRIVDAQKEGEKSADRPEDQTALTKDAIGAIQAEAGRRWAEQGLASLVIDLQHDPYAPSITFRSLGIDPQIRAVAVETRRIDAAAWGLGMLVFLVGVGMTRQSARRKWAYVLIVLLASTVPLLITRQLDEVGKVLDYLFYAAALLVPYYLVAAIVLGGWNWLSGRVSRWFMDEPLAGPATASAAVSAAGSATAILLAVALALSSGTARGQMPIEIKNLKDLLPILDPGGPVTVPKDAIIIPYDPDKPEGLAEAVKVLVPYDKYVELWNRANPEKKLTEKPPPAPFALAGASYQATLADGNELLIAGKIEIALFTDKPVVVPLNLVGGVLVKATLDGQPARLQSVQPQPAAPNAPAQQPAQTAPNPNPGGGPGAAQEAVLLLHASGKGHKTLELTIRLGLARQGGWRISGGRLPAAPSTSLTLTVPQEQTEVRLSGLPDKGTFESTKANDQVQTALAADGSLSLQWRPKVTEGMVDQSQTAQSASVIDVRDDAVRLVWQTRLEFGRSTRDMFRFSVPLGYLVEQVTGENIRGFVVKEENGRQSVDVTLLKAAVGKETVTIHLSQRGVVGQGDLAQFAAPEVRVDSAVLHQGEIAVRRSTRLDLRAVTVADLSRADADGATAAVEQLTDAAETSFVPLKALASYRFVREGFKLTLAARPLVQETSAQVRAIVRAGDRESSLDAAILFGVQGEPLYRARIYLPDGFELSRLLPEGVEWAITEEEVEAAGAKTKRQLLTVHLQRGQTGEFQLAILGKLPPRAKLNQVTAPRMEILDVARQEGEIVFLPEPDTDIDALELAGCQRVSAMESFGWLQAEQRHLAKYALRYRAPDYSATLTLRPRTPRITATTLTNVRITPKAIEESLLFRYLVEDAGVRELSVILPAYLRKARLPADLAAKVQQKIVEPAVDGDGKPIAGRIRVRFILPEHQQGQIDLGLLYDRLLSPDKQAAAIPEVPQARTHQRFLVIENIGRDEVVAEGTQNLEPISQGQGAYSDLLRLLPGGRITQAYLVSAGATAPQLAFRLQSRSRAVAAGATIGLARTRLVVDAHGAYRGVVEFNLKNETEQYLEVQLPPSAQLWTATVRGEPAKPVEPTAKQPGVVWIPLVKAARGEGDYAVILKYGGSLGSVRELNRVSFPLITTTNIQVEQSQVSLYVPRSHQWFDFGGTMKHVTSQSDLESGYQSYFYKQIEETKQLLAGSDDYTRTRAMNNLKQLEMLHWQRKMNLGGEAGDELVQRNDQLLAEARELANQQQAQQEQLYAEDNRSHLFGLWRGQTQERSKNVVGNLRSNFDQLDQALDPMQQKGGAGYNAEWFARNKLASEGKPAAKPAEPGKGEPADPSAPQSRVTLGKKGSGTDAAEKGAELQLNDFERDAKKPGASEQPPNAPANEADRSGGGKEQHEQQNIRRYQERLEQKQMQLNELQKGREFDGRQGQPQADADGKYYLPLQSGFGAGQPQVGGFDSRTVPPGTPPGSGPQPPGGMPGMPAAQGGGVAVAPSTARPQAQIVGEITPDVTDIGGGGMGGGRGSGSGAAPAIAGLASLDVEIPQDGVEYLFTTPRGKVEITARPVSHWFISRLWGAGGLLAAVVVLWVLTRPALVRGYRAAANTVWFAVALIVVGLASLVLGILPLAGLIAAVVGAGLVARRLVNGRKPVLVA